MSVRVYLEDTDAGGIAYHASYLRFMERARSDWLREAGIGLDEWQARHRRLFVVRTMTIDWQTPARLDDRLTVCVNMLTLKRASVIVEQPVLRGDEVLTRATVQLACLDADRLAAGRSAPVAIPPAIREAMSA